MAGEARIDGGFGTWLVAVLGCIILTRVSGAA